MLRPCAKRAAMAKRICMVAYTHYRSDARPRREAEALAARGDEVDFLALSPDGETHEELLDGVNVIDLPSRRYRGKSTTSYLKSYTRFFAQAFTTLTRRHLTRRYDVIYAHTMPDFIVFAATAVKALGVKVVLDLHDTMPELYQSKFGLAKGHPVVRAVALQERLSCRFADKLVCVHQPHKELLVSRGVPAEKISVLLNVPDPRIFGSHACKAASRGAAPRLVYHGTIAERLGLDVALHAFVQVLADYPEARFDIFGSGDFAPQVERLVTELHLDGKVHFPNEHFRLERVPELVDGATVGIVPNRDDPATRYMLPVKLLEYVHLGIPTVAPRLPAISYYFDDDAVSFYAPGEAASMADAILRVLRAPAFSHTLVKNAAEFSERFGWQVLQQDLFRVIDN